jgi:hypothetical protein
MDAAPPQNLVPNRHCGDCNACCSVYEIRQPELQKPAYTLCPHWSAAGQCTVYDNRPMPCRTFFCVWRKAATLDDWWRPDRCGVIIRETAHDIPDHFPRRTGLAFDLAGARGVIHDDRFITAVAGQIAAGVPVILLVPGQTGSGRVFLNDRMAAAVASRNRALLVSELDVALADAEAAAP